MSTKPYVNNLLNKGEVSDFFGKLFQSRDIAHLCHLRTTSFSQHMALGSYYDSIIEQSDSLIEMFQGKYELVSFVVPQSEWKDPIIHLQDLAMFIEGNKNKIFTDSYLLNQIDGILELIYSTLYKLKNLK